MSATKSQDVVSIPPPGSDQSDGWKISATSVCGSSHEKLDLPCQDAHFWTVRSDGILLAAVADGAGSAKHSDVGAKIASQAAVETLCTERNLASKLHNKSETFRPILLKALKAALKAVKAEAKARTVKNRDLASTLIVVIATPQLIATAQIGDGAAVASDQKDHLIALTTPDSGEYINQTTFLISPKALATAQLHIWHGSPSHIAIFSDGLQMLALTMPFGKPHQPFFSPLFRFVSNTETGKTEEQLTSFLRSPRVRERTDDDLTLMLVALPDCAHATTSQI
ncbi:MAG: PP2C family serine/threonine-protein phosphatase [Candidatus Latescibacteria bacterium]|jgi:serine/threonine protein phosphatase PrpC|nr:PP2C family serine/threonine-protein phosphatase [Candidatus Latescibacterota bacterium]